MTPRHRRWLIWAMLASLLLHIVSIGSDTLYLLAGEWARDEPLKLRKPTKKLANQQMDDVEPPASLAGIKPAEKLTISIADPSVSAIGPQPASKPAAKVAMRKGNVMASIVASQTVVIPTSVASSVPALASSPSPIPIPSPTAQPTVAATLTPVSDIPREKPFPRKVEITYTWAGIPIKMTWDVEHGLYKLMLRGALFGRTREISSEGRIGRNGVVPQRFADHKDGKLLNEAVFDWENLSVQMNDDGKLATDALKPGDQDLFSAAFQFALQGAKMKNFTFSMVSGRKFYRGIPFELLGESTLMLSGKRVDAVLLRGRYEDRVFDFWLAPEWNNMPVRIHLTLGKENTFDIWASQISINGEAVLLSPVRSTGMHRP